MRLIPLSGLYEIPQVFVPFPFQDVTFGREDLERYISSFLEIVSNKGDLEVPALSGEGPEPFHKKVQRTLLKGRNAEKTEGPFHLSPRQVFPNYQDPPPFGQCGKVGDSLFKLPLNC